MVIYITNSFLSQTQKHSARASVWRKRKLESKPSLPNKPEKQMKCMERLFERQLVVLLGAV